MARYTKDINAIYISERMQETLSRIKESTLTSIVAPMGYGKTTAALWYMDERQKKGDQIFRVNIYSSDVNLFWKNFCSAFRGTALGEHLSGMDFPVGPTALNMLIQDMSDYLNTIDHDLFLLIDDCHLMEDIRVFDMLFSLCRISSNQLHIIVISRSSIFMQGEELLLGRRMHRITVDDMRLNRTELSVYLRRCGVDMDDQDFETLLRNSEGWFSFIYLNIRSYENSGALLFKGEDIYAMIGDTLYARYDAEEQYFLLCMCIADEFTIGQAEFITEQADARTILRNLAQHNAFIRYLPDTSTYRFHHMLRGYAEQLFGAFPEEKQKALRYRYGQWHESQEQYMQAIYFYEEAGALSEALHVIGLDCGVQLASMNPAQILAILEQCGEETLMAEPQALLVLMRRLFSWRQIPKMLALKELLLKAANRPGLTDEERNNLLGECDLVMSFLGYNDIAAMSALHQKAASLMTRNAISTGRTGSYTFGSPSVLMMFHRESGKLSDEVDIMNRAMPFYYQVTDHHGMGAELVMEAEALYHRGKFVDARIVLQKAKAACSQKPHFYLPLCCEFVERRLALFGEEAPDADWYAKKSVEYRKANDPMIFSTLDGCMAYLAALTGNPDEIPAWIAGGELAQANLLNPARPMFEIIYNEALLAKNDYIAVVARGEQLLATCRAISYLLCEIHLHIQMAIANEALGKTADARKELQQALDLALPDGIIVPFAEHGAQLEPLLPGFESLPEIAEIRRLYSRMASHGGEGNRQELDVLTEREQKIVALYVSGKNRKEIADELFLAEGTIKNQIRIIYEKLNLTGSTKQKHIALTQIFAQYDEKDR